MLSQLDGADVLPQSELGESPRHKAALWWNLPRASQRLKEVQARTLESKFENASSWIDKEPCTPLTIDESIMETSEVVGGICLIYCACGGAAEVSNPAC